MQTLSKLTKQLIASGLPPDTPAVAVERGTTPQRRVVYGTCSELHELASQAGLRTPTLILMGQVVALSPGWQEWREAGQPLEWNGASTYPALQLQMSVDFGAEAVAGRRRQKVAGGAGVEAAGVRRKGSGAGAVAEA